MLHADLRQPVHQQLAGPMHGSSPVPDATQAEMIDLLRDASASCAHAHAAAGEPLALVAALQIQHEELLAALRRDAAGAARVAGDRVWSGEPRRGFEPKGERYMARSSAGTRSRISTPVSCMVEAPR
jgi:hypothetical protein